MLRLSSIAVAVVTILGLFAVSEANIKRSIHYTEIPTFPNDYNSVLESGDEILEPIYKLAKDFIDSTVPTDFHIGSFNDWEWNHLAEYAAFLSYVIVILLIGILTPLIGIIFAISRCAGFCGAKPSQKKPNQGKSRIIIAGGFTIIFSAFLVFGIVAGIQSNIVMENGLENIFDKAIVTMQDTVKYSENTNTQLQHLLQVNYNEFSDGLSNQLSDISVLLSTYINDIAKPDRLNEVVDGLVILQEGIVSLKATETYMGAITQLPSVIQNINGVTRGIYQSCLRNPVSPAAEAVCLEVEQVLTNWVVPQFNFPDVSSTISSLDGININGLKSVLNNLQKFGTELKSTLDEFSAKTKSKTDEAGAEIQSHLEQSETRLAQVKGWIRNYIVNVDEARHSYENYRSLRFGLTFLLPILLVLIMVFVILGFLTGICCRSAKYKEKCCSGNSSIASAFFMTNTSLIFIFTILFAVEICGYYIIGLIGQRFICNTLDTKDNVEGLKYLDEYLDVEHYFGQGVTLEHLLNTCDENKSIYEVLILENEFDLAEIVGYLESFGIKASLDEITTAITNDIDLFSANFPRDLFAEFKALPLNEIKVELYEDQVPIIEKLIELLQEAFLLDPSLTAITFVVSNYKNFIAQFTGVKANFEQFQTEIKMGGTLPYLERISEFENYLDHYRNTVAHGDLINLGNTLTNDCLDSVRTYLNRIADKMIDTVGLCHPASVAMKATLNEACGNIINPINAYWVGNFFALVAFIPLLILFTYLVNYFQQYVMTDEDRICHQSKQYYPYYPPGSLGSHIQAHDSLNNHHYQTSPLPQIATPNIYSTPAPAMPTHIQYITQTPQGYPNRTVGDPSGYSAVGLRGNPVTSQALSLHGTNLRRQLEYPYAMKGTSIAGSYNGSAY